MEVDWNPTSSPSGSRHASPFHHHLPTTAVTGAAATTTTTAAATSTALLVAASSSGSVSGTASGKSRKRRRSSQQPLFFDSAAAATPGGHVDELYTRDRADDESALPLKRINNKADFLFRETEHGDSSLHYYRPLGAAAAATPGMDAGGEFTHMTGSAGGNTYDGSDYGMDSPMHSLSLLSRSPSTEDARQHAIAEEDVEMGMTSASLLNDEHVHSLPSNEPSSSSSSLAATTTTSFVPRQVRKPGSRSIANAPVRPSPLAQQTDERVSSTDSSPLQRSMERSASSDSSQSTSSYSNRRHATRSYASVAMDMSDSNKVGTLRRVSYQDTITGSHTTLRRTSRTDRAVRTPSPHPQPVNRAVHDDSGSNSSGHRSALHPSPGLSQSTFPGGKQMLRYTMGYRDDCEMCKNKVPGHYGHVVHRST